jgi:hypothetical protein
MEHTLVCFDAFTLYEQEVAAWRRQYPHACQLCQGAGGHPVRYEILCR